MKTHMLNDLEPLFKNKPAIFTGLTANIDQVIKLQQSHIDQFVIKSPDWYKQNFPIENIASYADLLHVLAYYFETSQGGEWHLNSLNFYEELVKKLPYECSAGGTGLQAAMTLGYLGVETKVNIPLPDPKFNAMVPSQVHLIDDARFNFSQATRHMVFEFTPDLFIFMGDKKISCKRANRLIMPWDPDRAEFYIQPRYITEIQENCDVFLLSGYNLKWSDNQLKTALTETIALLQKIPQALCHFEFADFPDSNQRKKTILTLSPYISSLGLNEDEIKNIASDLNIPCPNIQLVQDVGNFATYIKNTLNLKRCCIHTKTYSIVASNLPLELEKKALQFGNLVGASRAYMGNFPKIADLQQVSSFPQTAINNISNALMIPSYKLPKVKGSLGLGDSFTAAMLAILAMHRALDFSP